MEQLCENDIVDLTKNIAVEGQALVHKEKPKKMDEVDLAQMTFLDTLGDEDILSMIRDMDLSTMTPLEAMNALHEIQVKVKNRW